MSSADVAPPRAEGSPELFELAQRGHYLLETLHVVVYFAAEPAREYEALGLRGRPAYFASRGAALGAVPGAVIAATFGVFAPDFVARAFPKVWEVAAPAGWLDARQRGVAATLNRVLGGWVSENGSEVAEALELARTAASALTVAGRPLYAANAALPWPNEPVMALWQAATLLREHRGDGHLAALAITGVAPLDAMVLHGIVSRTTSFLQSTRGWPEAAWDDAVRRLQERGLLEEHDPGRLTDAGRELKATIEQRTRTAALVGWDELGVERAQRLIELLTPIREPLMASDVFPPGSPLKP